MTHKANRRPPTSGGASTLRLSAVRWLSLGLVAGWVSACEPADEDADGFLATVDCDDSNPNRAPDNVEECNGIDDDCDGIIDENLTTAFYPDLDGDGFGDRDAEVLACSRPESHVTTSGDCDDANIAVYPGAVEACNGFDDDCDDATDENFEVFTWYEDVDGDGFGATAVESCTKPENGTETGGDCDDADEGINPAALEACDGVDENCNEIVDEGAAGGVATWADTDDDGYGDPDAFHVVCDAASNGIPDGYTQNSIDCDDTDASTFQGAPELCDDEDNDCDDVVDEDIGLAIYVDADGDGFGNPNQTAFSCEIPAGWSANSADCNDAQPLAHTGAAEACDTVDNDCDGAADEGVTVTWWPDADLDGYGSDSGRVDGCSPPADAVYIAGDCDDAVATTNPEGVEVCDLADNDCDGNKDEGLSVSWFVDADGDTFGDPDSFTIGCVIPANGVQDDTDCDDAVATTFPGSPEVCNLVDDDCDSLTDDGVALVYWVDGDGDGVGTTNSPFHRDCSRPAGYAEQAGDCDDANNAVGAGCVDVAGEMGTFGVDAARTGHQPGYLAGSVAAQLWSTTVAGATLTAPSIDGGVVYFTSNGATDTLHARDLATGDVMWDFALTSGVNAAQPTVDSGLVYAHTIDSVSSTLVAVDAGAGTSSWSRSPNALSDVYKAPLAYLGDVYIGAGAVGGMFGYDGPTGGILWNTVGPDYDDWTPVGYDNSVYVQVGDDLLARDPATGSVKGSLVLPSGPTLANRMSTVPAVADDVMLLIAGDDLVAVDINTAKIRWTIADGFSGSPTVADGLGYAVHSGEVWQVDVEDSVLLNTYTVAGQTLTGKPLVTDDAVIIGTSTANYVFGLSSGDLLYSLAAGEMAVAEDTIAITSGATITVLSL